MVFLSNSLSLFGSILKSLGMGFSNGGSDKKNTAKGLLIILAKFSNLVIVGLTSPLNQLENVFGLIFSLLTISSSFQPELSIAHFKTFGPTSISKDFFLDILFLFHLFFNHNFKL